MTKRRHSRQIPVFDSEQDERAFWETHDTSDYVDWSQARAGLFPNLKPSRATISLRLPVGLLAELKAQANRRDVPYQSLLKIYLAERVTLERVRRPGRAHGARPKPANRSPVQV
jgi:predicted DNA binding CopG/RHH family protein